jgi:hypothetical protein
MSRPLILNKLNKKCITLVLLSWYKFCILRPEAAYVIRMIMIITISTKYFHKQHYRFVVSNEDWSLATLCLCFRELRGLCRSFHSSIFDFFFRKSKWGISLASLQFSRFGLVPGSFLITRFAVRGAAETAWFLLRNVSEIEISGYVHELLNRHTPNMAFFLT